MTDDQLIETISHDLSSALARETPGREVADVQLVSGGRSAITVLADVVSSGGATERLAVRALDRNAADLAVGSLRDQFELLELLRSERVLAPRPVLLAEGVEDAAYDLLVTSFVSGRVPQPWRRAGRAEIATLRDSPLFREDFVETLARIHAVEAKRLPERLAHEGDDSARTHSARARARCATSFRASGVFEDDPVLTYCLLWLEENRPASTFASGLVHGDYRLGNLVVDPDGRLCGVLDWELAEAGETLSDVAWLCGPQALVDGYAGGLFGPDDLVAAYERATGRSVDGRLFEHLKVEGTMRTAAVWAQLSVTELERQNPAMSIRCQESALELVAMCAESVGLAQPSGHAGPTTRDMSAGIAVLAGRLRAGLITESRTLATAQPAASRHTVSFLGRLSELLSADEHEHYAHDCAALAGTDVADAETPPGTRLSAMLRRRHAAGHRLDNEGAEAAELRRLVGWSASPPIAFANLLCATGARSADR